MLTKAEVQRVRSLQEARHRQALGLFAIEGEKAVAEFLAARHPIDTLYATADWLRENEVRLGTTAGATREPRRVESTPAELARLSHFPSPPRVIALAEIRQRVLGPGELDRGLTLVLDGIQDPGNLGTLLRLADWYGLDRVLAAPGGVEVHHQKVINASMGSFCRVAYFEAPLVPLLTVARAEVFGCDLEGESVHRVTPPEHALLVVGSEGRGLSPAVRACIRRFVTIPRHGAAESLNAALAAAIVCDNFRRTRPANPAR